MTTPGLIPSDVASRVGSVVSEQRGVVVRREWQRWAMAVGDRNPLWFDPEIARDHGYRDVVCPPLYLPYAALEPTPVSTLQHDGSSTAAIGDLQFPRAPRRMAAGESMEFHRPAYDGEEISMVQVLESVEEKVGRSGRFVLCTWAATYRDRNHELLCTSRLTMVARS